MYDEPNWEMDGVKVLSSGDEIWSLGAGEGLLLSRVLDKSSLGIMTFACFLTWLAICYTRPLAENTLSYEVSFFQTTFSSPYSP